MAPELVVMQVALHVRVDWGGLCLILDLDEKGHQSCPSLRQDSSAYSKKQRI